MAHQTDAEFVEHQECPSCGSSDACALYDDGHRWCFACSKFFPGEGEDAATRTPRKPMSADLLEPGTVIPLTARGINEETCKKWSYTVGEMGGKKVQIANYRDRQGAIVAQKVRGANKQFVFLGDSKACGLYGQHLWRDGGKMLVVTEGEIDALSVSQIQQNKWPVVSVPTGAAGAKKAIARELEWVSKFDEVIFMFDMDEPGRAAAAECAQLLPVGKAKIASLPEGFKDPNEMLQAGKAKELIDAMWGAKPYRPDGIVTLADLKEAVLKPVERGLPWWMPSLTEATYGRRFGEVYAFGAGTGVGKTDWLTQQIMHDIVELEQPVALFFLEQQPVETAKRVAGKVAGRRFHVPDDGWTVEELMDTWERLERSGKLYLYDHFGSAEWDVIESRIRFLAHSEGVRLFYVDHLTALADPSNERESLETTMAALGGLVKELDITIHLVSHLATPEGKPHEEGGRVMIRHFKGSRAIGFWCHYMFGLERDQQAEDEAVRKTTTFRILKDRYTGQATGRTFFLGYDVETGRLFETDEPTAADNPYGFTDHQGQDVPEDEKPPF